MGANLGEKRLNIEGAAVMIAQLPTTQISGSSKLHTTKAVGGPARQPSYLNAVLQVQTELSPQELMESLLEIEQVMGRDRTQEERFGPRTLDLDLLLYDDLVLTSPDASGLTVPHPRMQERLFVLEPLAEIAPELVHPVSGKTVKELLDELKSRV